MGNDTQGVMLKWQAQAEDAKKLSKRRIATKPIGG